MAKDRARANAAQARYRARHPEKVAAIDAAKYAKAMRENPEKMRRKNRTATAKWRKNNPVERESRRSRDLKKLYDITLAEYSAMLDAQAGVCYLCKAEVAEPSRPSRPMYVDHCHVTGTVRKLLCNKCNMLVGRIENHPGGIEAIASYLAMFKEVSC